jgi:hypothetical protein
MANTFKFGNGNWAVKDGYALAYNDENNNFKPLPFDFTRASSATTLNRQGLIETVPSGKPRIDFLNNTKGHLLLEPSRTNIALYSEDFTNSAWIKQRTTITGNQAVSSDGSVTADKVTGTGTGTSYFYDGFSVSSGTVYTISIFAKKINVNNFYINNFSQAGSITFDLSDGTIDTSASGTFSGGKIENYGNGWYRLSVQYTASATASVNIGFYGQNSTLDAAYVWGVQIETGSYQTSYVKTEGSSVTRVAETANSAGNDSIFNESEGVLYAEIAALDNEGSATSTVISINDGTSSNRIHLFYFITDNTIYANYRSGGITRSTADFTLSNTANINKFAYKWKSGDFALWVNGVEVDTDTNTTMISSNTLDELDFNAGGGGSNFYGKVKDLKVYNTALTDTELQNLTS